jgi:hypothetical protein
VLTEGWASNRWRTKIDGQVIKTQFRSCRLLPKLAALANQKRSVAQQRYDSGHVLESQLAQIIVGHESWLGKQRPGIK